METSFDVEDSDQNGRRFQPAVPVPNGKFAVWIFLSTEFIFFAALIGTYLALRSNAPQGRWPTPEQVQLVVWAGASNTGVLIASSVSLLFALKSAKRDHHRSFKGWLLATVTLGCVFLGITTYQYHSKYEQGIYPRSPRSLLYHHADLNYLAGLKADCDAQILQVEKQKTDSNRNRSVTNPSGAGNSDSDQARDDLPLERLKLIRVGLIRWTENKVSQSDDSVTQQLALVSLAHQIYPLGKNEQVADYLANELQQIKTSLAELQTEQELAIRNLTNIQQQTEALADSVTNKSKKQSIKPQGESSDLVIRDNDAPADKSTREQLAEKTQQAARAASEVSRLKSVIASLNARIQAVETFAENTRGINETDRLKLPMVIPSGNTWVSNYFLLTSIHAMHVLAGLALIGWQIGSSRVGSLENVSLYWHFVNIVGIILFVLFYLL